MEEGQGFRLHDITAADPKLKQINYPIGKPLEVSFRLMFNIFINYWILVFC